ERAVGVDVQERVYPIIDRGDPVQVRPGYLDRGDLAGCDQRAQFGGRLANQAHASSSRIRGTRNRPSAASGAPASTAACGRHGTSTSSRSTFVSGTECEVGGMSAAATSPTRATAWRITSSWPANTSNSSSVTA